MKRNGDLELTADPKLVDRKLFDPKSSGEPQICSHCAVRHKAICRALEDDELASLNRISHQRKIPAGQVIFSDEDIADFCAIVVDGVVKLTKTLPDGRQQIVGLSLTTDFLGRTFSQQHSFFAEAATDVQLCCFPHDEFEGVLKQYPNLEHRLFEETLNELDSAREWMLLLGRKTAAEKVASFLLMIAKRCAQIGCSHSCEHPHALAFELPLTRADMADFLGITIETVSRQITKLKNQNIISIMDNRHIIVLDQARLAEVACVDEYND